MSFARVWTGFDRQNFRGNLAPGPKGLAEEIDPMQIKAEWRDVFPKSNSMAASLEIVIPSADLPAKHFSPKEHGTSMLGNSLASAHGGTTIRSFALHPPTRQPCIRSCASGGAAGSVICPAMWYSTRRWHAKPTVECEVDTVHTVRLRDWEARVEMSTINTWSRRVWN